MFANRRQAGERLGLRLAAMSLPDPVVYAIPRGGLPVAAAVADRLGAPLDIVLVRKLGAPGRPELAIGAVVDGADPIAVLHDDAVRQLAVSPSYIADTKTAALVEIARRRSIYAPYRPPISPAGRSAIVVDDGIATGATVEVALKAMRAQGPACLVLAVPVAPADTLARLGNVADRVVCLETPALFRAVGLCYADFGQLGDDEARRILDDARKRDAATAGDPAGRDT